MRLIYQVEGDDAVVHDLLGLSARAVESRPILEGFAAELRKAEGELFDAEGKGAWPPLAASTIAAKGSSTILVDTGALKDSLTSTGGDHVEMILGDELVFGTSDPKAKFHRSGTSRMPRRDPLPMPGEGTIRAFSRSVQSYLMGLERAQFGVGSWGIASFDPFGLAGQP